MNNYKLYDYIRNKPLDLFIRDEKDLDSISGMFFHDFQIWKKKILDCDLRSKDFLLFYDQSAVIISYYSSLLSNYLLMGKNEEIQKKIQIMQQELSAYLLKEVTFDKIIFKKITKYYTICIKKKDLLPENHIRYITTIYNNFKRSGASLSAIRKEKFTALTMESIRCSSQMQMNLATTKQGFYATHKQLKSVPASFLETLKKNDAGEYFIGVDYPTNEHIMKYCDNRKIREKLYKQFSNRGYPENVPLMKNFYKVSQKIAALLGYENYAEYNITPQNTMAQSTDTVKKFIDDMNTLTHSKTENELNLIKNFAKHEFKYDEFYPWDLAYCSYKFKTKQFNYDEKLVSEYLPVTHCIEKILDIYKTFLNVTFTFTSCGHEPWAWDSSLKKIEVYNQSNTFLGTIILDLFPRTNKYTHACASEFVTPYNNKLNGTVPGLCFMVSNCVKPTAERDGLFSFGELETFFHELGHLMHFTLYSSEFAGQNSFDTPIDFVELPSQMFEQWLQNPTILSMIGKHYQTGESLPYDLIEKIIANKKFLIGYGFQRQVYLALIALKSFSDKTSKLIDVAKEIAPQVTIVNRDKQNFNFVYSFMHLCGGYAARYYSYMWSLAYALDIFDYIKEHDGLLNGDIGEELKNKVLAKGASADYTRIIESFTKRPLSLHSLKKHIN